MRVRHQYDYKYNTTATSSSSKYVVNTKITKVFSTILFACVSPFFVSAFVGDTPSASAATTVGTNLHVDIDPSLTLIAPTSLSLGPITPIPEGTELITDSGNIIVSTNNTAGYTLTMSMKAPATTNALVHTTTSSYTIPSLMADIAASAFPTNQWGYSLDYSATGPTGTFKSLPNPSSATPAVTLKTTSAPAAADTTPFTVGTRVDTDTVGGIYQNTLTFTAVTNAVPTQPTVSYDANGGSNPPAPTLAPTFSTETQTFNITSDIPTAPSGKVFDSWNTQADGSGASYNPGASITTKDDVTLYAQWDLYVVTFDQAFLEAGKTKDPTYNLYKMQDMTSSICAAVSSPSSATAHNEQTTTLVDIRDGKIYSVGKLMDGNCWMTENLRLGSNSGATTVNSADTDIASGSYTLPQSFSNWPLGDYSTPAIYYDANNTGTGKDEIFYNFNAATAGTADASVTSGDASGSVCPKGWKIPTGGESSGQFKDLHQAYGSNYANLNAAFKFAFAGAFYPRNTHVYGQGDDSNWWSSTAESSGYSYFLYARSDGTIYSSQYVISRLNGEVIRCVNR